MPAKLPLIIFGLIAAAVIGGTVYAATLSTNTDQPTSGAQQQSTTPTESSSSANDSTGKTITSTEVAKHASSSDCWLIIEGKVYDVTKYITSHPGGAAITSGCGKDATAMFNQRPQDGESHSSGARSKLQEFYIGDLTN